MRNPAMFTLAASAAACLALVTGCSDSGTDPDASPSAAQSSTNETSAEPTATSGSPSNSSPSMSSSSPSSSSASAQGNDIIDNPPAKNWQDALDAARKDFSGDVSKIELESSSRGGLEYKIELKSADTKYAVQYDADNLDKISEEKEGLGDDAAEERKETFDPEGIIGLKEAVDKARQQQDGAITKWKIEGKDTGRVQYEFDILPDGASDDHEIQIDANDGSVIADS